MVLINEVRKLKPCPFCGCGLGDLYIIAQNGRMDETVGIFCNGCKQTTILEVNEEEGFNEKTVQRAVEAWNRREVEHETNKR